jgi:hypothetical protein
MKWEAVRSKGGMEMLLESSFIQIGWQVLPIWTIEQGQDFFRKINEKLRGFSAVACRVEKRVSNQGSGKLFVRREGWRCL